MKILLVEDNLTIIKGLKYSFANAGYELSSTNSIKETIEFLNANQVDLIILDLMLPDGSGEDLFLKRIKQLNIPTLFLTAKDDVDLIVKSLNNGVEDYLTKPFSPEELLARVNRILMRLKKSSLKKVLDISFDMNKMIVYKNNEPIELTSLELKILHLLFLNINHVVLRQTLLDKIWDWTGNIVDDHTVTVYLKRIRQKIQTNIITTIKGIGYRIDEK